MTPDPEAGYELEQFPTTSQRDLTIPDTNPDPFADPLPQTNSDGIDPFTDTPTTTQRNLEQSQGTSGMPRQPLSAYVLIRDSPPPTYQDTHPRSNPSGNPDPDADAQLSSTDGGGRAFWSAVQHGLSTAGSMLVSLYPQTRKGRRLCWTLTVLTVAGITAEWAILWPGIIRKDAKHNSARSTFDGQAPDDILSSFASTTLPHPTVWLVDPSTTSTLPTVSQDITHEGTDDGIFDVRRPDDKLTISVGDATTEVPGGATEPTLITIYVTPSYPSPNEPCATELKD